MYARFLRATYCSQDVKSPSTCCVIETPRRLVVGDAGRGFLCNGITIYLCERKKTGIKSWLVQIGVPFVDNTAVTVSKIVRAEVPKLVLFDLAEVPAAARKAAASKANELGLKGVPARRSAGFNAHLVSERMMKEVCESWGGIVIEGGVFPGTELTLHQQVYRYGRVIISRATIHQRKGLPSANVTRRNGAHLNRCVTGDLFGAEDDPNALIHVLLLTLPDFGQLEKLAATYIAVVSPSFDSFLLIEEVDDFIAGYDAVAETEAVHEAIDEIEEFGLMPRKDAVPYMGEEVVVEHANQENG